MTPSITGLRPEPSSDEEASFRLHGNDWISAATTAAEIQSLLVQAGARQVLTEYDDSHDVCGIHFILPVSGQSIPFKMPVKTAKLEAHFKAKHRGSYRRASRDTPTDKAKRVAWRQLLRWVEAQVAFIESGMAATEEVFMPYIEIAPGKTVYQHAIESKFAGLLPASTQT